MRLINATAAQGVGPRFVCHAILQLAHCVVNSGEVRPAREISRLSITQDMHRELFRRPRRQTFQAPHRMLQLRSHSRSPPCENLETRRRVARQSQDARAILKDLRALVGRREGSSDFWCAREPTSVRAAFFQRDQRPQILRGHLPISLAGPAPRARRLVLRRQRSPQ